jgi:tripartite-type tricarboxylate transporter receptor subunit TctC
MKFPRFRHAFAMAAAVAATTAMTAAYAQKNDYPSRPITIVVPYAAGGSTDGIARILGQHISQTLKQPVVIDNKGGAASNIGVGFVSKAAADGYTLGLVTSTAMSVNPGLYKTMPFNAETAFDPIVLAAILPSAVFVNANSPINTLKEFNEHAKKAGGNNFYASAGSGSAPHLGAELYRAGVGFDAVHIPFKGGAPALTSLAAGETTFMVAVTPEGMPLVQAGKLKALAVTTQQRLPAYPNLPTVSEAAIPGYELVWGFGFVAPKGTPAAIITQLNKAFNQALKDPHVAERLQGMGYELVGGQPARLPELMNKDRVKWKKIIDELGIEPN